MLDEWSQTLGVNFGCQVKNLQIELKGPTEWSEFPIKHLHIYIYIKHPSYVLSFIWGWYGIDRSVDNIIILINKVGMG